MNQLGTYHMVGNDSYEPQRKNNFEVQIVGLTGLKSVQRKISLPSNSSDIITLSVASAAAPSISIDPIIISYGNNKIKFAGTPTFNDSSIVLNDYIGLQVEKIIAAWHSLCYDPQTQKVGLASNYKKTAYLIQYAPDGTQARSWMLVGCWPSSVEYGDYSYEDNSQRQVTMTLVYDYAIPTDD